MRMLEKLAIALYWSAMSTVFICLVYLIFLPNEPLNDHQWKSLTYYGAIVGVIWLICFLLHWAITGRLPWPANFLNKPSPSS